MVDGYASIRGIRNVAQSLRSDPSEWETESEAIPNLVRCLSATLNGLLQHYSGRYPTLRGVRKVGKLQYGTGEIGGHDCAQRCLDHCISV